MSELHALADPELIRRADDLADQIHATADADRPPLHEVLHALIDEMKRRGVEVAPHLRDLDHRLEDAEIEDRFDNMPL